MSLVKVNIAKKGERPFYTWGLPNGKGGFTIIVRNHFTPGIRGKHTLYSKTKELYGTGKRLACLMFSKLPKIIENVDIIEEIIKRLFRKTHPHVRHVL
jgi:hypothetical protein